MAALGEIVNIDELNKLCAEIEKNPMRVTSFQHQINAMYERKVSASIAAVLESYYLRMQNLPEDGSGIYPERSVRDVATVTELYPARVNSYTRARCLSETRPGKLSDEELLSGGVPPVDLYQSKPGRYVFSRTGQVALLLDETDGSPALVRELSSRSYEAIYSMGGNRLHRQPLRHVSKLFLIHDQFSPANYCHWMLDWLPRLLAIREAVQDTGDFHIAMFKMRGFHYECFDLLGIPREKIIELPEGNDFAATSISCDSFLGTSLTNSAWRHALHAGSPWQAKLVRKHLANSNTSDLPRRFILDRRDMRKLVLEDDSKKLLEKLEFARIYAEDLSLSDQIRLFSNADCIIAAHGAGLTNTVFCSPEAKVLEIFPPGYSTRAYWLVANAVGLNYSCFVAERASGPERAHPRHYDCAVPQGLLLEWLTTINTQK